MAITDNETARFTVSAGGGEFDQREPMGLEYIGIEDHVKMIGMCEITFSVGDENASWSSMEVGSDVEIKLGGDTRPVFVGSISGLRHAYQKGKNTLTVMAMDPLMKLSSTRTTKVYEEMKHSDIASEVISRAGATPGTIDATDKVHPYTLQRNESDLRFLRRLAAENHMILMANEGKVDFKKPQTSGGATEIGKDKVISMDYSFSPRDVPKPDHRHRVGLREGQGTGHRHGDAGRHRDHRRWLELQSTASSLRRRRHDLGRLGRQPGRKPRSWPSPS